MQLSKETERLARHYRQKIEPLPPRVPLDLQITHKRKLLAHEEWRIEYAGEGPGTMPEPALHRIPAYLLVPSAARFCPPYPAMVCLHQCNCDCWIGKDAVIGRQVDRPDQAYGYELVQQGFVVIAPDHWLCGERHVPGVREEGQQITDGCYPKILGHVGRRWEDVERSLTFDSMRAVDVLETLDFVDAHRIGVIGHSLGGGGAASLMAADERVKAGIASGSGTDEERLACIVPRLFMELRGLHDRGAEETRRCYETAKGFYADARVPQNLVLRMPPGGHYFQDEFKREAYYRLKQHFGMLSPRQSVSIESILRDVQTKHWWESQPDREWPLHVEPIDLSGEHRVLADTPRLTSAIALLIRVLFLKAGPTSEVSFTIASSPSGHSLTVRVSNTSDDVRVPFDTEVRNIEQALYEHSAGLERNAVADGIQYVVKFAQNVQE